VNVRTMASADRDLVGGTLFSGEPGGSAVGVAGGAGGHAIAGWWRRIGDKAWARDRREP